MGNISMFVLFLFIILSGCISEQETIEQEIEKANYCQLKSDCILIKSECPFGCYIPVNKQEENYIINLIDDFGSKCVYSCIQIEGFDCIDNKCVLIK